MNNNAARVKVGDVMRECRNYFQGPCLTPDEALPEGAAWAAVEGLGVYEISALPEDLPEGARIWPLYPPDDFLELCERIADWDAACPAGIFLKERLGDYEYAVRDPGPCRWPAAFERALRPWRRMFTEVDCSCR